jgi:hypothetical protein
VSTKHLHFFLPTIWEEISNTTNFYGWNFLKPLIGKDVFWASVNWTTHNQDLPNTHEYYLIKTEGPNCDWIHQQAELVDGTIFVLCLPNDYGYFDSIKNVIFLPCVEWHYQLEVMQSHYGTTVSKSVDKKVSVLTNRMTYSKIVALATVLHQLPSLDVCYSLHNWVEDKDIHHWQNTSNATVNYYKDIFLKNLTNWLHPLDKDFSNQPEHVYNYHHMAYQQCAINITNESWNYSLRHDTILPGPFITEKTLKCLLGETAFLANGQYNTYHTLEQFGFVFDYGLDLSFDQEQGDLVRLEKLTDCIKSIEKIPTQDLFAQTKHSCLHNKDWIVSNEFYRRAEEFNVNSLNKMLSIIK